MKHTYTVLNLKTGERKSVNAISTWNALGNWPPRVCVVMLERWQPLNSKEVTDE